MSDVPKLTMKMIANDSRWGPSLRSAKTFEDKEWVCDRVQEEWNRLHCRREGHVPCTIITAFGTYEY